jgi:hypothetical protein
MTVNITSQNTRFAMTRVGFTCVPERSTAWITPPRSRSWLSRTRRSSRSVSFSSTFASR